MAQETETPRTEEAALVAARRQAMKVVLPQGVLWADAAPAEVSGAAESAQHRTATASAPERPPLDLGAIPPDMASEAAEIIERYRNDPSYDARSAVADFKTLTEMKKAEIIHLQHDAHSAEERREKLWESLQKSMAEVDKAFLELDHYLTDEERQNRAELDKALKDAKTDEEREEAARQKRANEMELAERIIERAERAGDHESVDKAQRAREKLDEQAELINQHTEERIMADNTMSYEEKQLRIKIEKERVSQLELADDANQLRYNADWQMKSQKHKVSNQSIPSNIAEEIASVIEAVPGGYEVQEACVADSREPSSAACAPKGKVTVVTL